MTRPTNDSIPHQNRPRVAFYTGRVACVAFLSKTMGSASEATMRRLTTRCIQRETAQRDAQIKAWDWRTRRRLVLRASSVLTDGPSLIGRDVSRVFPSGSVSSNPGPLTRDTQIPRLQ